MKAIARHLHISSRKLNLIAELVRNKNAKQAVNMLKFTPKKGARLLKKVIESAMANAENNLNQKKEDLFIKEIVVTEGPTAKRFQPVSRGRAHPILKRTAHVTVDLSLLETHAEIKPSKEEQKTEPKAATEAKTETTEKPKRKRTTTVKKVKA